MKIPKALIDDMLYMQPKAWVALEEEDAFTWWRAPCGAEIYAHRAPGLYDDPDHFPLRLSWRRPFSQRTPLHALHFADIPMVGQNDLTSIQISCDAALQARTHQVIKRLQKILIEKGETEGLWYFENGGLRSLEKILEPADLLPDLLEEMLLVQKTCALHMPDTTNIHETFVLLDRIVIQLPQTFHKRLDILQS